MLALALVGFALSLPALRECWRGYSPTIASTFDDRGRRWMRSQALLALPGRGDRRGHDLQLQLPRPRLARARGDRLGADHRLARARAPRGLHLRDRVSWAPPVIVAGVAIPVIAALPELIRILSFAGFEAFSPSGAEGNTGYGNLRQALNPLEALGVWPSSEFRLAAAGRRDPAARLLRRRAARRGRSRLGARPGLVPRRGRAARRVRRRRAGLPGRAGGRHSLHLGQGAHGLGAGRDADRAARACCPPTASRTRARARPTGGRRACCARWSSSASRRSPSRSSPPPPSRPCCRCASPPSGPGRRGSA